MITSASKRFIVSPGIGLGALRFGIDRDAVELLLGAEHSHDKRPDGNGTYATYAGGAMVGFDRNAQADYLSIAIPDQALLDGVELLGRSARPLIAQLADRSGPILQCDDEDIGFILPAFGLRLIPAMGPGPALERWIESMALYAPGLSIDGQNFSRPVAL